MKQYVNNLHECSIPNIDVAVYAVYALHMRTCAFALAGEISFDAYCMHL